MHTESTFEQKDYTNNKTSPQISSCYAKQRAVCTMTQCMISQQQP